MQEHMHACELEANALTGVRVTLYEKQCASKDSKFKSLSCVGTRATAADLVCNRLLDHVC